MIDTDELKTEGILAIAKNMRIGHYAVEAANEIERLREALKDIRFDSGRSRVLAITKEALGIHR